MASGSDSDPEWAKSLQAPTSQDATGDDPSTSTTPGPKTRQGKAKSAPPPSLLGGALSTPSEAQDAPPQSPGPDEKKADGVENAKTTPAPRKEIASRLPLVMGKNANQTKLIFEIDSEVDLEGDTGVVGRVKGVGSRSLLLDLKGAIYEGSLMPCATICILNLSSSLEAKVENISNSFVQLHEKEIEFIKGVGNCDSSDDEDEEDRGAERAKAKDAKDAEDAEDAEDKEDKQAKVKVEERSSMVEPATDEPASPAKSPKSRATPTKRKLPSKAATPSKQAKKPAKKK